MSYELLFFKGLTATIVIETIVLILFVRLLLKNKDISLVRLLGTGFFTSFAMITFHNRVACKMDLAKQLGAKTESPGAISEKAVPELLLNEYQTHIMAKRKANAPASSRKFPAFPRRHC